MQFFPEELRCTFNLRKPNGKKPTNIYMVVRMNGKQYKLTTGLKVYPSQWNKRKELAYISEILSTTDNENNVIVNKKISDLKKSFLDFIDYLCNHPDEMDIELLKKYVYKDCIIMTKKKQTNLNVCLIISKEVDKDMNISEDSKNNYYNYLAWFEKFLKYNSITFGSDQI